MKTFAKSLAYFIQWMVLVIMIAPLIWLVISSFRPNADLFNAPFSIPQNLSFDNYISVLQRQPMFRFLLNTVIIVVSSMAITVTAAVLASYAFMHKFRLNPYLALILTVGLFVPTNAFLVPYFVMITRMGLFDSIWGIVLVYAGINTPMSIMVIKGFMSNIPKELLESARIDGARPFTVLRKIVLPISIPGIVTACIFQVINSWNELLFASVLNQSDRSRTIQVAIRFFLSTFEANHAYAFAAMVMAILPTVIVYAFLTDQIISGMTAGAVKE